MKPQKENERSKKGLLLCYKPVKKDASARNVFVFFHNFKIKIHI